MRHLAIVIDWYGPYSISEALHASKHDGYGSGLYMGIGKQLNERGTGQPQYIGLSKNLAARLANHHKLPDITRDAKIWLGEVATAEPSGQRQKTTSACLDYAEWLHAFFLQLPLNDKKKINPPNRSVTALNRWWRTDYETPWIRRPHPLWPDLIDFAGSDLPAKIIWFGKKQQRIKPPFLPLR